MAEPIAVSEVPWDAWYKSWGQVFKQSQHVTVIGPTGCGKTTLCTDLVKPRKWVTTFGVKHYDETMSKLIKHEGYVRITDWKHRRNDKRLVLWPKVNDIHQMMPTHKRVFEPAINEIYKKGGWTLWLDEMRYMADHLGMTKLLTLMYVAARSNNVSIVGNTQRPAWVPLEAYSQAGHLILFNTGDERDLIRIGSLNGANAKDVARIVSELPERHFLHVDLTNRRHMAITSQPKPTH